MSSTILKRGVGILLAVTLGAVAGCGSDDDKSSDTTSTVAATTTAASTATTAAATADTDATETSAATTEGGTDTSEAGTDATEASTGSTDAGADTTEATTGGSAAAVECTGDSIKLSFITNLSTDPDNRGQGYLNGAQAAAEAVNKTCQAGQPIEIVPCDTKGDVNVTDDCAREAVDAKVLAEIDPLPADSVMPILSAAGIPSFGNSGNGSNLLTDPLSFPTFPVVSTVLGFAAGAKQEGAKTAQLVVVEGPNSSFNVGIADQALGSFGIESAGVVTIPPDAADLTVYAGQIISAGADAVLFELGPPMTESLLKGLQQQGADFTKTQIWNGGAIVTQQFVDDFDGSLDGVYTAGPFWPATDDTNPRIKQMLQELTDAGLPATGISDWETTSWSSVHVLADVIADLPSVDTESLVAALNKLVVTHEDYPETGGYDFTQIAFPDDPVLKNFRIFGRTMYLAQIQDGVITPIVDDFVDVLPAG